jgi:hypothetical protein
MNVARKGLPRTDARIALQVKEGTRINQQQGVKRKMQGDR